MATHSWAERWAVDHHQSGLAKRRGSYPTRKAAGQAAARLYQRSGVAPLRYNRPALRGYVFGVVLSIGCAAVPQAY